MLDSNHLIGFGVIAGSAAKVNLVATASSGANQTTYTFNSVALGAAFAAREMVVGVVGTDSANAVISSVTIDAAGMTERVQAPTNETVTGLFQRALAAGTTATIAVTFTGQVQSCFIAVWAIEVENATPTDTDAALDANPMVDLLNVLTNGIAIAIAGAHGSTSAAWAGLTEAHDEDVEGNRVATAAHSAFSSAQTNLSIGPTFSGGGPTHQSISMAAWR